MAKFFLNNEVNEKSYGAIILERDKYRYHLWKNREAAHEKRTKTPTTSCR
jgi:hypothetical protein